MHLFGRNRRLKRDDDTFVFDFTAIPPGGATYAFFASDPLNQKINEKNAKGAVHSNPLDYFELIGDKEVNPKKIKRIRIITDDIAQLGNPFVWYFTDSNGEQYNVQDQPLNMLSPMQFQSRVIDIEYDNLVLGNNECFTWYVTNPQFISLTLEYEDFRLENLLLDDRKVLKKRLNLK